MGMRRASCTDQRAVPVRGEERERMEIMGRVVEKRDASGIEKAQPAGIVIHHVEPAEPKPLIAAFIWGGKVRPEPTLPFGRWKPSAA